MDYNTTRQTLYVTDLDGTLMRNDKTLSQFTIDTFNRLIGEGALITYATARTLQSSYEITKDVHFAIPVITRNGTVLADHIHQKEVDIAYLRQTEIQKLREILKKVLLETAFVTTYINGVMNKRFCPDNLGAGFNKYVVDHANDKTMSPVSNEEDMWCGDVTYVTLIAEREKLQAYYDKLKECSEWECVFQKDTYGEEYWLEICPKNATKAKAVLKLKESLGCDRVVVFGDSTNDLTMFAIADEALAVENAIEEVKTAASGMIESNEADGVAKYLAEQLKKQAE